MSINVRDIAGVHEQPPLDGSRHYRYGHEWWRATVTEIIDSPGFATFLSKWERSFVESIRFREKLTHRQHEILERIAVWMWHKGAIDDD
jgi:hypothetical protein